MDHWIHDGSDGHRHGCCGLGLARTRAVGQGGGRLGRMWSGQSGESDSGGRREQGDEHEQGQPQVRAHTRSPDQPKPAQIGRTRSAATSTARDSTPPLANRRRGGAARRRSTRTARWSPQPATVHRPSTSTSNMTIKLRRVIIAARFRNPCPEQATPQETRAVLAAWAAAGT
jgi:hypothetical protein